MDKSGNNHEGYTGDGTIDDDTEIIVDDSEHVDESGNSVIDEDPEIAELAAHGLAKSIENRKAETRERLPELSPTQKLYIDVFGDAPEHDIDEEDMPDLLTLLETLRKREPDVIKRHFGINGEAESYAKIANDYGVSPPAINAVGRKALERLRGPHRAELLKKLFMSRGELRETVRSLEDQVSKLNKRLLLLQYRVEQENAKSGGSLDRAPEDKSVISSVENMDIRKMETLSSRAYYVLRRTGIETVGEAAALSRDDLEKRPYVKAGDVAEIEAWLNQLGLSLKDSSLNDG